MGTALSSIWNWRSSSSSVDTIGSAQTPGGVNRINDSLYELYSPLRNGKPWVMDVIFFHGLQQTDYVDAYWKTWSSDGTTIWPQTFLGVDFPGCRVLSVSYDSCAAQTDGTGRDDIHVIGEILRRDILEEEEANVGALRSSGNCPVILVGHCLGGLVIKQFLLETDKKRNESSGSDKTALDKFLDTSLAGIFYYATPHGGTVLADLATNMKEGPLVDFVRILGKEAARLNNEFRQWRNSPPRLIPVYSIAENRPTSAWGINTVIVEEASVRQDTDKFYTAAKDHITVCKPTTTTESTYRCLRHFINEKASPKMKSGVKGANDCDIVTGYPASSA